MDFNWQKATIKDPITWGPLREIKNYLGAPLSSLANKMERGEYKTIYRNLMN